jgi:exo-1,4-beta-D-glucosaminidase
MLVTMRLRALAVAVSLWVGAAGATDPLISENGRSIAIPNWRIQSSAEETAEPSAISRPGFATSSWRHVDVSRCTVLGCLVQSGLYNASNLFFSENLAQLERAQFQVPWLYSHEFRLHADSHRYFHLVTHGISSRADIFLNGNPLATKEVQSGAYGGHIFDISSLVVDGTNALVIQVYPTDYSYDFAVGFVDWNPPPPDRGMGVWRDVEIKQSGPLILGPLLISTTLAAPGSMAHATVTMKATIRNLENVPVMASVNAVILGDARQNVANIEENLQVSPMSSLIWSKTVKIDGPDIWWPRQWGKQPLYQANLTVSANGERSDTAGKRFGIRNITSTLNRYNDTAFIINGEPFQVIGAGYSSDMFLRWDTKTFVAQAEYALDLGLNTLRLEGKMEHPELYEITDRLGLMVLPGWECCDKWEAWSYNPDLAVSPVPTWTTNDYGTANASIRHEALMLQNHPSVLGFLVGSDYWPDDSATEIYIEAFKAADWQMPIISSASKRGYPEALGPSGMKMSGPYDWVPPNYFFDAEPSTQRFGAAFGFGSELGAGVGTPEVSSLRKFLSQSEMDDLWRSPNKTLYHMSLNGSQFDNRAVYNGALWQRYGAPKSLDDYIFKSQIMDYEATRAQFEAFASRWKAERPATGLIYWMFNNAWPSLHWNMFDYYLRPAGSYFGTKTGSRTEHVAYDYVTSEVYIINRSLNATGTRTINVEIMTAGGKSLHNSTVSTETVPNTSKAVLEVPLPRDLSEIFFLKLNLANANGRILSRNVYWLANTLDTLDWNSSTWYHTPVVKYADFKSLASLAPAAVPEPGEID